MQNKIIILKNAYLNISNDNIIKNLNFTIKSGDFT